MRKYYSVVFLSIAFLSTNCYAQDHRVQTGPASHDIPYQSGHTDSQAAFYQLSNERLVHPPSTPSTVTTARIIDRLSVDVPQPAENQVEAIIITEVEKSPFESITGAMEFSKTKSSLNPLKIASDQVTSENEFEVFETLEVDQNFPSLSNAKSEWWSNAFSGQQFSKLGNLVPQVLAQMPMPHFFKVQNQATSNVVLQSVGEKLNSKASDLINSSIERKSVEFNVTEQDILAGTPNDVVMTSQEFAPSVTGEVVKTQTDESQAVVQRPLQGLNQATPNVVLNSVEEKSSFETSNQITSSTEQDPSEFAVTGGDVPAGYTNDAIATSQAFAPRPVVGSVKTQTGFDSGIVVKAPLQDLNQDKIDQNVTPVMKSITLQDTTQNDVKTQHVLKKPQEIVAEGDVAVGTSLEQSEWPKVVLQSSQIKSPTPTPEVESPKASGFDADELNFDAMPIPAENSVAQTTEEYVSKQSTIRNRATSSTVATAAKKKNRVIQRKRTKVAAGWWWAIWPLLAIPTLCMFVWGWLSKKKRTQAEVTHVTKNEPSSISLVSKDSKTTVTLDQKLTTNRSVNGTTSVAGSTSANDAAIASSAAGSITLHDPSASIESERSSNK